MKCPKGFRGKYFSLAAILALNATVTLAGDAQSIVDNEAKITPKEYAPSEEETLLLEQTPVVVVSKKIKVAEIGAPFASEVYTKKEIQKSHSKDIYEFLNTQTSVTTMPSYGNPFSQAIDMRGYGLGTGYENIVISVDGRRLNNIDMTSQLLSAISLESIERIEIIKGSGSVEYGDGGNAGVINIITKGYDGATVKTYVGNNGLQFASVGLGIKKEHFSLSGYFDDYGHDGFKAISSDGTKDESWSRNKELKGTFTPVENLTFNLGKSFSKMQINYANALTLLEYNTNPNTIPSPTDYGFGFFGPDYKIQSYDTNILSYGFNYKINEYTSFDFQGHDENKKSSYEAIGGSSPGLSESQYNYKSYNSKLNFTNQDFKALIGVDLFDGERDAFSNIVTKDNTAYYSKLEYAFDSKHSTSFGARHETVKYEHNDGVMVLKDDVSLNAFDVGYNYKIDKVSSLFVNINTSYQAPNIDRFFKYNFFTHDYEFNAFIKPMKVKTLNTGYSYLGYPNKLKVSLFYSDIDDEIYYNATTFKNTNFDQTRKYGLDLYDKYNFSYNLFSVLNYSFVDSKIKQDSTYPNIDGKDVPGVSAHTIKIGLGYNPIAPITLMLSETYKSSTYAIDDFDGNFGKMKAYTATDFSATYMYKNYEFFVKVNNLFDTKNAMFTDAGDTTPLGVYPLNYERTFMLGFNAKF